MNAPSKLDTVICVVVPQSTEGEVAPLAPALLSVTDINGMSLKGSSKYIEHLLFMFALTSEDIVNCIMQSLSIFIFLRVAFLQFVTLLVTSLFSTLNKFSTVENLITLNKGDGNFETNIGGLIIKVFSYPSKTGLNRYNFYTAFPNKCLVCILTENDGIRNTEPALEVFDKNGFKANNTIGTGQFFCTAIGY